MQLVERHIISKNHFNYKQIDELCFISKNLYNQANYIIRQEFVNNKKYLNYYDIDKLVKNLEENNNYKLLQIQSSQQILKLLDKNWKSFFKAIKDWSKNKSKYLGKPKLPKYKDKNGRNIFLITNQSCKIKDNYIYFNKKSKLKPIKTKIDKLNQVRFIPNGNNYIMEVIYEKEIKTNLINNNVIGIDLGLNNFATITDNIGNKPIIINGKIIKSFNVYYNKKKAKLMSFIKDKGISNKIRKLTNKRNNKLNDFYHKTSKFIIDYCLENKISKIIIGYNKEWKQNINIGKKNNQNFVNIAYLSFINKLDYKAKLQGIELIKTEESYTSKCSFIDNEELNKQDNYLGKRIKRGLFKSLNGILINADINGSYNIIRKVISKFKYEIEVVGLQPIKLNII